MADVFAVLSGAVVAFRQKLDFSISVNWLVGVLLAAVALVAFYIWGPDAWHQTLVFIAAVLAATGAFLNAANGLEARGTQSERARQELAIRFVEKWIDPQFHHCKKSGWAILMFFKENPAIAAQLAHINEDATRRANLADVLNHFELLGIAVDAGIADEKTAKRFYRTMTNHYWHLTAEYIKKRRAESGHTRLFQEFEALATRWKD